MPLAHCTGFGRSLRFDSLMYSYFGMMADKMEHNLVKA